MQQSAPAALVSVLWPAESRGRVLRAVILVALGVALLTISAKIRVPFWPVPMTMQTAAVLLIGATYGVRLSAATVGIYLLHGALGLPVFTSGAGLAYLAGPTGGYLTGFLVAAVLLAGLVRQGLARTIGGLFVALLLADMAMLALGTGWLASSIGTDKAVAVGLLPFLPAEALKVALVAAVVRLGWSVADRSA